MPLKICMSTRNAYVRKTSRTEILTNWFLVIVWDTYFIRNKNDPVAKSGFTPSIAFSELKTETGVVYNHRSKKQVSIFKPPDIHTNRAAYFLLSPQQTLDNNVHLGGKGDHWTLLAFSFLEAHFLLFREVKRRLGGNTRCPVYLLNIPDHSWGLLLVLFDSPLTRWDSNERAHTGTQKVSILYLDAEKLGLGGFGRQTVTGGVGLSPFLLARDHVVPRGLVLSWMVEPRADRNWAQI